MEDRLASFAVGLPALPLPTVTVPSVSFGNGRGDWETAHREPIAAPPLPGRTSRMRSAPFSCGETMDIDDLRKTFSYDPETGAITRRKTGRVIGKVNNRGYVQVHYRGALRVAHRLAFAIMEGREPKVLDHINRDRSDNRWCNLREVTPSQNMWNRSRQSNNTSGYKGVYWHTKAKKYRAKIKKFSVVVWLGDYDTAEAAAAAYNKAALELHGEFACLNEIEQVAA